MKKGIAVRSKLQSVRNALRGLRDMLASEPNARIHAIATVVVVILAYRFKIEVGEWALIILVIAGVWMAEAFNTVLELMANLAVGARYSKTVKRAKDIAAGGVLVAAIASVCVGLIVLGPPLLERLESF